VYDDFIVPSHVSTEDGGPVSSTLPGWSRRNWVLREASELLIVHSSVDSDAAPGEG